MTVEEAARTIRERVFPFGSLDIKYAPRLAPTAGKVLGYSWSGLTTEDAAALVDFEHTLRATITEMIWELNNSRP